MVCDYLRRQNLADHDVHFIFTVGDKVLLCHRVPGKLNLKVQGPYIFVKYTGRLQVTAVIAALDGGSATRVVSAANLLPMRPSELLPYGPNVWEEVDDNSSSEEVSGDEDQAGGAAAGEQGSGAAGSAISGVGSPQG